LLLHHFDKKTLKTFIVNGGFELILKILLRVGFFTMKTVTVLFGMMNRLFVVVVVVVVVIVVIVVMISFFSFVVCCCYCCNDFFLFFCSLLF